MKKYKVYYQQGDQLGIGENWQQQITAETPEEAYREYVKKVGAFPRAVNVATSRFGGIEVFSAHVEEAEKRIEEEKAQTGKHPQESTDKENSNLDQPNIDAKTQDSDIINQELDTNLVVEHLQLSNKILGRIQALQERQINEIKSVQWWMRFGIFMILLQIITAKIKLGL